MAEQFKLTPDEQRTLRDMNQELLPVEQTLAKLRMIGTVDTTALEERLEAAKRTRAGFLEHFGAPMIPR